jgi:hypothetical protein
MNAHYRTLAEYILREITLQQNHSQTFMQKVQKHTHTFLFIINSLCLSKVCRCCCSNGNSL